MEGYMQIELNTPSDVTETAYLEARGQLITLFDHGARIIPVMRVSLADMDEAVRIMAAQRDFEVLVSLRYGMDEWSLEFDGNIVHSPGA